MQRIRAARAAAVLLIAAAGATTGACDNNTTSVETREVTLGGVFSLTGNWSSLGLTSKAAMELAVNDVNAYLAGTGLSFRADVRDTRLDPATALADVQSLRASGVRFVIGPQSSAELAQIKPWVDANPMLVVSQSSTAGSLAVAGDNILRFTPSDSLEGVAVAALAWADGIRTLVPVWRADAGNQGLHTATAASFTALGGTMSGGIEYPAATTAFGPTATTLGTQVRQALAAHSASQVGVYLAGFDEVAQLIAAAASDSVLGSVKWYGSDGVALSSALLTPGTAAFSQKVGYPNPVFGLDPSASGKWQPVAARIKARAGTDPDAFALAVYDAVWVAAQAYLAAPVDPTADALRDRFVSAAGSFYGTTGWTTLNAAGDRAVADFDFWAVRTAVSGPTWLKVASYDTKTGSLTH